MCAGRSARTTRKATRCRRRPAASASRARWSRWRRWRSRRASPSGSICCIGSSGAPMPESACWRRPTIRRCGAPRASPSRSAPRRTGCARLLRYLPVHEGDRTRYLGWYEPAHYVLEANAQLIARRFPDLAFSILTPDGAAHWDGTELRFSSGCRRGSCRTTRRCNRGGARITRACCAMLASARDPGGGTARRSAAAARSPAARSGRAAAASGCSRCRRRCTRPPIAAAAIFIEPATQTVFGEGPAHAKRAVRRRAAGRPGGRDRPPVRRAGRADHGSRDGGGRHRPAHGLHHQCGEALQVRAPRQAAHPQDARGPGDPGLPLLARCRAGAVCGRSWWWRWAAPRRAPLLGRAVTITRERGRPIEMPDGQAAFVTVHPSFLLRVPDEDAKAREYRAFVADLRKVAELVRLGRDHRAARPRDPAGSRRPR